jgi:trimethylamine--corrinoid protein Co-methyltransferase
MPRFLEFLSEDQVQTIHAASVRVLEKTGIEVENENVMKIFTEAGADTDLQKRRVYLSEALIKEALKKSPSEIKLFGLDGKQALAFGGRNIYFNPGSTALYMLDRETMKMRRPSSADFTDFVRLTDYLQFMHAQSTAMTLGDVPDEIVDRVRFYLILKNSPKPIIAGAFSIEGLYDMKHMLEIVVGGEEELRRRPRLLMDVCPSPPLKWSKLTSQNLIDSAEFDIPIEIIPAPQLGSTAPATLAGLLVQHNAEFLSGLVMAQLVKPGLPCMYSGSPSLMDMRYGTGCVGNVEVTMLCSAYAQIARFYHIPSGAYMGISEAKLVDAQSGLESAVGLVGGTLAGINCITGPGMLGFENCQSFEKLVIDNDICGMALRLMKEISFNDETLALDLISKVGPGGHFLSEKHTLKWFQIEEFMPSTVIDKISKPRWESMGAKDALKRAKEQVDKVLSEHHPKPLEQDTEKELDSFIKKIVK